MPDKCSWGQNFTFDDQTQRNCRDVGVVALRHLGDPSGPSSLLTKVCRAVLAVSIGATAITPGIVEARAESKPLDRITPTSASNLVVTSPDGTLAGEILIDKSSGLSYQVVWSGHPEGGLGHIGLKLQHAGEAYEIGRHPIFETATRATINEQYRIHGAKAIAHNTANVLRIRMRESNGSRYAVEARAFDNGFAWRILVGDSGSTVKVSGETSTWILPQGEAWFGERNNDWKLKSYAGEFRHTAVDNLPSISEQGRIQTPPLVVELTQGAGFELVTEADLENYSGMRLRAAGNRRLEIDFTEGAKGFEVAGELTTPWRVTLLCRDLNCLVNNTLIQNLNRPPDPVIFRDTSYIHEGRFVWRYMSRETGSPSQEAEFVDFATALGYEYTLVDDGWARWATPWPSMKQLVQYAKSRKVGVFAWKDSKEISNPAQDYAEARTFLDRAMNAGLAGVKIDFINDESKEKIDFERRVLTLAAERRLMVDFHGLQKPTGEERTFPNGMSREAVRGIELNRMPEGPVTPSHNAALPFTRFAIGPADYTPVNLQWPGTTTWSHQLATAILLSSPWLVIAEDPEFILKNADAAPALSVFRELPASWDETVVLDGSRIGGLVGMGRRKGSCWFLTVINGSSQTATLPRLPAEINLEEFKAMAISSPEKRSFLAINHMTVMDWRVGKLRPGDGLVVVLKPKKTQPK